MEIWRHRIGRVLFWPLSFVYGCGIRFRNACFRLGWLERIRLEVPVVCVGNITVGGTGKTPVVIDLADRLCRAGRKPAVISRGYGRESRGVIVVSSGREPLVSAREAGDEPYALARRLKGVPVVVGEDRVLAGRKALELGADILIMDDGFQHRRLIRDLDMVVMDAADPWGNGGLLPGGPLREPLSALRRARGLVLTHVDDPASVDALVDRLRKYSHAPVIHTHHQPTHWVSMLDDTILSVDVLRGKRVLAFSGIGSPISFVKTLKSLEVNVIHHIVFQDHHWYSADDISGLIKRATDEQVDAVVTTEKDAARWTESYTESVPLYFLRIDLEIVRGDETINALLASVNVSH